MRTGAPTRRQLLAALGSAGLTAALSSFAKRGWAKPGVTKPDFSAFLQSLWPAATALGVRRATFDTAVAGLTPDPAAPKITGKQAEFDKPLQSYFQDVVSDGRIARGRALAAQYAGALASLETRFGVPGEICLAAWGLETDFGRVQGNRDIVRTLATLAYTRPDRPVFRDEFVAALLIIDRGTVPRERLRGSWAGAMGNPQFLPSAYLKYAVSAAGNGAPDIWTNPADTLASIANFLRAEGWSPSQPWIQEVVVPDRFDAPTLHGDAAAWTKMGLRRPDGRAPTGDGDAALFLPSGSGGPGFLLFPNYFVIKQYNNSDSYALSFGSLAQRIGGAPTLAAAWPTRAVNLSRTDKIFIQRRLTAMGLYDGPLDGKFGPKARDAIYAFQRRAALVPADGFATPALVAALRR